MVNYAGILISVIANVLVGMIWYSPKMFGNYCMKSAKLNKKEMEKGMAKGFAFMIVSMIVMAYVLDMFINTADTALAGAQVGFFAWLGFIATVFLGPVFWEGKPLKLRMVYAGNYLISLLITGAILAAW